MKKSFFAILLIVLPSLIFAENTTVRIGINLRKDPQTEKYYGYGYEYLQEIAQYTGWNYEYVPGTRQQFKEWLLEGKIDFAPGYSGIADDSRFQRSDCSVMSLSCHIFRKTENDEIKNDDISSLSGKTVGVEKSSETDLYLKLFRKRNDLDFTIIEYDDYLKLNDDFYNTEKLDLICATDFYATKLTDVTSILEFDSFDIYLYSLKSNFVLNSELNNAQHLLEKDDPYYLRNLKERFYDFKNPFQERSEMETEWINSHKTITVGFVTECFPFCSLDESGNLIGFLPEYFMEVYRKSGLKNVTVNYVPFDSYEAAIKGLKSKKADVIFPVYGEFNEAEKYGIQKTENVDEMPMELIFKDGFDGSDDKTVITMKNAVFVHEYASDFLPELKLEVQDEDIVINLDRLLNCKDNAILLAGFTVDSIVSRAKYKNIIRVELSEKCPVAFAVDRENTGLLCLLNKSIKSIDKNFASNIFNQITLNTRNYGLSDFVSENIMQAVIICCVILLIFVIAFLVYNFKQKKIRRDLNRAILQAESANQAKSKFLNNMSHDIRTPMNAIIGFTTLAKEIPGTPEKTADYLSKIETSSKHLLELINEVLDMSRIESGKVELTSNNENLQEIINEITTIIQPEMDKKNINFDIDTKKIRHPEVVCDELRLKQVLMNLLGNAVKFTPENGNVWLIVKEIENTEKNTGSYRFVVKDDGIGMSDEFQTHLYEAFEREQTSTVSKTQGTGLGMSIAKNLIEMMDGTIKVESHKNQGTRFTIDVKFKFADKNNSRNDKKEDSKSLAEASGKTVNENIKETDNASKPDILLVEDNELNQEIAREILINSGYNVEVAEDGEVAVRIISEDREERFALILMDMQMPKMNGIEATLAIRKLGTDYCEHLPIIAMTANAFEDDRKKCLENGMDDFISKPFELDELLKILKKYS